MLLKLLPLDGCVSFRNTKVSQERPKIFLRASTPFWKNKYSWADTVLEMTCG